MKLILDQGLPRSAVGILQTLGYEAVHVGDIGMSTATDREIIALAAEKGAVVVTLDADFHAILALSGVRIPSVLRLRVQGKGSSEIAKLIAKVLTVCEEEIEHGAVVTANESRARLRRLPIT
jgi:predicted nuclease of predicted toxin-antitoxin system